MQEPITDTTNHDETDVLEQQDTTTEHTCACGEQYRHREGYSQPPGILHVSLKIR